MRYGTTSWSAGWWLSASVLWVLDGSQSSSFVLSQGLIDQLDDAPTIAGTAIVIVGVLVLVLYASDQFRADGADANPGPERDQPVLTDRERIEQLLDENGGRMKQADIVNSVEWSKAKVSRLLADLESDDEITKLRLGRENLICRPGSEPAASRSGTNPPGTQSSDE